MQTYNIHNTNTQTKTKTKQPKYVSLEKWGSSSWADRTRPGRRVRYNIMARLSQRTQVLAPYPIPVVGREVDKQREREFCRAQSKRPQNSLSLTNNKNFSYYHKNHIFYLTVVRTSGPTHKLALPPILLDAAICVVRLCSQVTKRTYSFVPDQSMGSRSNRT